MSRVLITGAGGGIGRAIAHAFATAGHTVAVHYSGNAQGAEETLRSLPGEGHGIVTGDISDPETPPALIATAAETLGGLDVLVNNAAVMVAHPIATTSYNDWRAAWSRTLAVNVTGTADVSYCAARHMIGNGVQGRIISIGSRGAFRGEPDHPAYGASKAAVHAMSQSLAVALAPHGIGVAAVAPGFTATDRVAARLTGAEGEAIRAQSPFGRVGTPEEVASAVLWLASPGAIWASGTVIDLNGASYLRT
ncbi:3-ketoacyl-ACP reductase [Actinorhabdospora filicis]|uniref:3-ketoacyl-ACP reductase n=1 Tax=Actinorhabdospora filicis TaxID=1785913 RepID=A0A9W6WBP2_9ACTN|nr:SDR family oxidoreductase [Actinorhabdospora filicis]GLZ80824.1 3-ketoacyl-ACP reductase [Actinorhabdospora filicis]